MNRTLVFKKIIYDTQISNGTRELTFFAETDRNDESVAEMTEEQILSWLFQNQSFKLLFCEDLFENYKAVESFLGVSQPFTTKNKKPGDIDLLLVDPNYPEKTIVFECKRVKAVSQADRPTKVNNVEKVKKGVVQAEFYQPLGFHQTYFVIILLDDGRKYKTANSIFRTTDVEHLKNLWNIPQKASLMEDIGIILVKVEQTTGKHINLSANFGVCIDRHAKQFIQSQELTNKVLELINRTRT
ncbi:MAG: hypothetical protein EOO51_00020 [Flavobacterium sp.]|nr:MAG: hypothetical protein EOO51_00020 [Flavobacterium sp.]